MSNLKAGAMLLLQLQRLPNASAAATTTIELTNGLDWSWVLVG